MPRLTLADAVRHKAIYDRRKAGESYEQIALSLGMTSSNARRLADKYLHLRQAAARAAVAATVTGIGTSLRFCKNTIEYDVDYVAAETGDRHTLRVAFAVELAPSMTVVTNFAQSWLNDMAQDELAYRIMGVKCAEVLGVAVFPMK